MSHQSTDFTAQLFAASWNHLLALMASHQLPHSARQTKSAFVEQLYGHLTNVETLTTIVAQLDSNAKDALRHLLAGGALPVHTFENRYGPLRPYKPWRKDQTTGPSQPWLNPDFHDQNPLVSRPPLPQPAQMSLAFSAARHNFRDLIPRYRSPKTCFDSPIVSPYHAPMNCAVNILGETK